MLKLEPIDKTQSLIQKAIFVVLPDDESKRVYVADSDVNFSAAEALLEVHAMFGKPVLLFRLVCFKNIDPDFKSIALVLVGQITEAGVIEPNLTPETVDDRWVEAFDVDANKVGKGLSELVSHPNRFVKLLNAVWAFNSTHSETLNAIH